MVLLSSVNQGRSKQNLSGQADKEVTPLLEGVLGASSPRKILKCTVSQVASESTCVRPGAYEPPAPGQTQAFKSRYFIHNNRQQKLMKH